ncbi:MAG: hypothetical protein D6746_01490, partial [Bacteroidetes bacterium]
MKKIFYKDSSRLHFMKKGRAYYGTCSSITYTVTGKTVREVEAEYKALLKEHIIQPTSSTLYAVFDQNYWHLDESGLTTLMAGMLPVSLKDYAMYEYYVTEEAPPPDAEVLLKDHEHYVWRRPRKELPDIFFVVDVDPEIDAIIPYVATCLPARTDAPCFASKYAYDMDKEDLLDA